VKPCAAHNPSDWERYVSIGELPAAPQVNARKRREAKKND